MAVIVTRMAVSASCFRASAQSHNVVLYRFINLALTRRYSARVILHVYCICRHDNDQAWSTNGFDHTLIYIMLWYTGDCKIIWNRATVFNDFSSSKLVQKSVENRWASPNYFVISSTCSAVPVQMECVLYSRTDAMMTTLFICVYMHVLYMCKSSKVFPVL
jgi:hypothetical protein